MCKILMKIKSNTFVSNGALSYVDKYGNKLTVMANKIGKDISFKIRPFNKNIVVKTIHLKAPFKDLNLSEELRVDISLKDGAPSDYTLEDAANEVQIALLNGAQDEIIKWIYIVNDIYNLFLNTCQDDEAEKIIARLEQYPELNDYVAILRS